MLLRRSLRAEPGDVLLNSTGTGTIGRCCLFEEEGVFLVDSHVTLVRVKKDLLDPRWLNLILMSRWGQNYLESRCFTGSTSQVELSRADLGRMPIPVPSIKEQRRIVEVIDAIGSQERAIEMELDKLRTLKQGVVNDLLRGRV
ncbi:restriction endonuclease subunit S [Nocardiopsis sp. CC223A]|uniref:restriction endonuclease subunit S n=1 Tax=Nocardiopsis sp. CC223A TaxID=3044051 RepID=UPI0035561643